MRIYGKIIETISDERIIRVDEGGRLVYLYMTRKVFKDFSIYFKKKPYVFVDVKEDRRMNGEYCVYDVNYFEKIFETSIRGKITYYDINTIRVDTGKLLEKLDNRMFLDLEFSLPAYYQSIPHIAEIVQYGIVIEMFRIVRTPEGEIKIDLTGKLNGHGAYLSKSMEAIELSRKKKILDKYLEASVSDEIYDELIKMLGE